MKTHNLRLNQNGAFVPVGNPTMVATGSYQPLTVFHHIDGSESLIAYAGTLLVAIRGEDVVEVATLPSIPSCGVVSGNMLIVMTESGAFRLEEVDATSGNIVMYMPGTAVTMEPAKRRRANMVIKAVLCTNDFVSPTARYPRPFAGGISSTPGEIIQLTVNL